ncbi:MAG TPA: ABC transporter permease subunit [Solirubrobacteraceae bacterium]|jgi:ABC-2 type transport system permease protein|nr:ABC transporter permease subunit [Solirubrobacteraceae bacterium]
MSVASAAPAIATPERAPYRRPLTLAVYRWELRKLLSQVRTYLGPALLTLLIVVFVVFESLDRQHGHRDNIFAAQITQSGLATPVLMLLFMSGFFLPVVAALVAGDIFANEDGNGTLKTILTRSVDRGQVFAAKTMAAFTYATVVVLFTATVATLAGIGSWGFHSVRTFSDTVVSGPEALLLVLGINLAYLIPLFAIASIGLMLSAATRNSAGAVVGTIGLVILLFIVAQIPGLEGIQPYLLTEQLQNWQGLLRTPTDWAPIAHSAWVCALYGVPALAAGYLVLLRRDVAGG